MCSAHPDRLVPVVLVVTACSGSSAVRKADVEAQVSTSLEQAGVERAPSPSRARATSPAPWAPP
jgi:hypothetical protein